MIPTDMDAAEIRRRDAMHDDLVAALAALVDRDLTYLDGFVGGGQLRVQDITRARAALARCRTAKPNPQHPSTTTDVEVDEADARAGMDWWNALSVNERRQKLGYLESIEWSPSPANAWVFEKRDRAPVRKE